MQGEEGHLDGEGDREGQEQPPGGGGGDRVVAGQGHQVEGGRGRPGGGLVEEDQGQDADQQERGSEQGVDEELERRVDPVLVAPPCDHEVHRHQRELEEHEEDEEVEGQEAAQAAGLQHQHPGHVGLDIAMDARSREGDREQHACQQHQEQRDAVDTELPADAEVAHPEMTGDELVAGLPRVELHRQHDGQHTRGHRPDQADQPGRVRP